MLETEAVYQHLENCDRFYAAFITRGYGFELRARIAEEQGLTSLKSLSRRQGLDDEFLLSQIPGIAEGQRREQEAVFEVLRLTRQHYSNKYGNEISRPLLTTLHIRAFGVTPQLMETYGLYKAQRWEEFAISFDTTVGQNMVLDVTVIPAAKSPAETERGFLHVMGDLPVHLRDQQAKEAAETYYPYLLLMRKDKTGVAAVQANIEDVTGVAVESGVLIPELIREGARFGHALYQIRYPLTEGIAPEWGIESE